MSSCERNIVEWIFMPDYKVVEVVSRRDLMKFIKFPDRLYKDCPQYVPALHSDQVKSLTKVSTLSYCKRKMWMVVDGKTVVGRICGMINPRYNALYDRREPASDGSTRSMTSRWPNFFSVPPRRGPRKTE